MNRDKHSSLLCHFKKVRSCPQYEEWLNNNGVLILKTPESPLDSKEIKPINVKGDQP